MFRDVDFTISNYESATKILRPSGGKPVPRPSQQKPKTSAAPTPGILGTKGFTIQKSFKPEPLVLISDDHKKIIQPELDKLKKFAKKKLMREMQLEKLIAQDVIKREDLQKDTLKQQQPTEKDKIRIDAAGKTRDEKGNLVFIKNESLSTLANKNLNKEIKIKDMLARQKKKLFDRVQKKVFHDSNLVVTSSKKRMRRSISGLQFYEPGVIEAAKKLYSSSLPKLKIEGEAKDQEPATLDQMLKGKIVTDGQVREKKVYVRRRARIKLQVKEVFTEKQWWDSELVLPQTYPILTPEQYQLPLSSQLQQISKYINLNLITSDVQLTTHLFSERHEDTNIVMPVYLTKDEKKRLKRRRKQERIKQRNDLIKLGELEPEKPKLKLSNMALVMKEEYILDPSRVESEVRKQIQERLDKHLKENASRKLTKDKKAEKMIRKLKRDSAKETRIAVFRIQNVVDRTHRFKIEMNAKQLAVNGFFFVPDENYDGPAVVIIEGGRRAIKFFKNLMLKRINWMQSYRHNLMTKEELQKAEVQNELIQVPNKCSLVWEAVINQNNFNKWRSEFINSDNQAISLLSERKMQHIWDAVLNFKAQA